MGNGWSETRKICLLLKFIQESNEFYIIRRLYGVLFLLIFIVTLYPDPILDGQSLGSFGERFFKGATIFILAWRAMNFQLQELWIIPEGKFGRFFSVLLPSFFIVGVYFAYDGVDTSFWSKYWPFTVAIVTALYVAKIVSLRLWLPKYGTYFLKRVPMNSTSILRNPIWNWLRNTAFLASGFAILGLVFLLLNSIESQFVKSWLHFDMMLLGKVYILDLIVVVLILYTMWFYSYSSDSHYYYDYLDKIEELLQSDISINPWLMRTPRKKPDSTG